MSSSLFLSQKLLRTNPIWRRTAVTAHSGSKPTISLFSNEATPTVAPQDVPFRSAKSRDLFLRITSTLSKEDVSELSHAINRQLGRVFRKNEFYYRGFGGRVAGGGPKAAEKPAVEVKSTFDLKLVGFDAKAKIKVIKEVRSIAGLGLKESKDLVEGVPAVIQKNLSTEKAEELKKLLESVGAIVELV